MKYKIITWIIAMILLVGTVSALGVTPGRQTINYESGLEKEVVLKILNSDKKDMKVILIPEGELVSYVQLNETEFDFGASDIERYVSYRLKLPESFDNYGLKQSHIRVKQVSNQDEGELVIGATVSVNSQIHVNVPYPGEFVKANLDVITGDNEVKLHILVEGLGESTDVDASISLEANGEEIFRKDSNLGTLEKFQRKELLELWKASEGDYLAKATVKYGDEVINLEKKFSFGSLLKAIDISVNEKFDLGDVAKFEVVVENGHETLEDVSVKLVLNDANGNSVLNQEGSGLRLNGNSKGISTLFWDTENVAVGVYTGKLILDYSGKTVERPVRINLLVDKIEVSFGGITGFAISNAEQPANTDKVVLLPILVGVIAVMGIVIVVLLRRKKKNV
jgi:hypothetical protein